MSKNWYLNQNSDVKNSNLNPYLHYFRYGRFESRTWFKPRWFQNALGGRGWVWQENPDVLEILNLDIKEIKTNYELINIYRIGDYSKRIRSLKKCYNAEINNK